jgi:hypothetical protein
MHNPDQVASRAATYIEDASWQLTRSLRLDVLNDALNRSCGPEKQIWHIINRTKARVMVCRGSQQSMLFGNMPELVIPKEMPPRNVGRVCFV